MLSFRSIATPPSSFDPKATTPATIRVEALNCFEP
jgi:hypothetical protein